LLIGHSTGTKHWTIPKGIQEENESFIETTIRETKEETNIDLIETNMKYIGHFEYLKNKSLVLYSYKTDKLVDLLTKCKCDSYFNRFGKEIPEIDNYKIIKFSQIDLYLNFSLALLLQPILTQLEK
jgi:putative (di)nucleoside polyphosphate hydrolase